MPMSKKSKILRFGVENVPNANLFCAVISSKSVMRWKEKRSEGKRREGMEKERKEERS